MSRPEVAKQTSDALPAPKIRKWAKTLLAPETYERTIGAAEADVAHELATHPEDAAAIRRRARWMFVRVGIGAGCIDRKAAARGLAWWLFLAPLFAVALGAFGVALTEGSALPLGQLVFLALALAFGVTVATTPRRMLAFEAPMAAWIAIAFIALVAATGDYPARWLAVGPLQIHAAMLALPFFVIGFTERASHGHPMHAIAMLAAMQGTLVASADLATSATVAVIGLGSLPLRTLGAATGVPLLAVTLLGVAGAAARDPMLAAVAHSEGIFGLFASVSPIMVVLGVAAIVLAIALPLSFVRRGDAWTRSMAIAIAAMLAVPTIGNAFADTLVPLLGYSGSTVIATYLALGALLSIERGARAVTTKA